MSDRYTELDELLEFGQRVRVRENDPGSCSYLHGATGVITDIRPQIRQGKRVREASYTVTFDQPRWCGSEGFEPLKTCAFPAESLQPLPIPQQFEEDWELLDRIKKEMFSARMEQHERDIKGYPRISQIK